jgi:hypothetical protein
VELKKNVFVLVVVAMLWVALSPLLGAGSDRADGSRKDTAPTLSQALAADPLQPAPPDQIPVCQNLVQTQNLKDLIGSPRPISMSCSGDDCGCYNESCSEICPSGDLECIMLCIRGNKLCAKCCCCPECSGC